MTKILSFGSLNLDMVYSVEHFVAPGETLSSLRLDKFCGGKGLNQSVALARAGATVYHAGMVGADGAVLVERLRADGVDVTNVPANDGATGHAIIQVDSRGQNCILLHGGANQCIDEPFVDRVLGQFVTGDIVLLQNEISCLPYIIRTAKAKGLRVALNPSPYNEGIEACDLGAVDYFILNEVEGEQITGKQSTEDILAAMRSRFATAIIVLTLGKHGVVYDDGNQRCSHGIYNVKVADTTAAGDTFTGYFLAAICDGLTPPQALELASKASSLAVSVKGASDSIPYRRDVEATNIVLVSK